MIWDEVVQKKTRDKEPGSIIIDIGDIVKSPTIIIYGDAEDFRILYRCWNDVRAEEEKAFNTMLIMRANGNMQVFRWTDVCMITYLANDR